MVTQSSLVGQADARRQIYVRGETVYQCDVCKRRIRVPTSKYSIDVIQRCIITKNCLGALHKIITAGEANEVSSVPPSVPGVEDWVQRRVFYQHVQSIEDDVWLVKHNLANKPSVQVFIYELQDGEEVLVEVDPVEIRILDLNTIEIQFDGQSKGQADCLAYSSANTVNPSVGTPTVVTQQTTLLTNNGTLTLATLDSATLINVTARYRSANAPDGVVDIEYVGIDDQPSIDSPWAGVEKIFLNGRSYTVRSFNIVEQELAPATFNDNLIANGTQFYFPSLSTLPNQNFILLGTPPFKVVDRVVDRYIDVALVDPDQPELAYTTGEAYAAPSIIKTAYPLIYVVD